MQAGLYSQHRDPTTEAASGFDEERDAPSAPRRRRWRRRRRRQRSGASTQKRRGGFVRVRVGVAVVVVVVVVGAVAAVAGGGRAGPPEQLAGLLERKPPFANGEETGLAGRSWGGHHRKWFSAQTGRHRVSETQEPGRTGKDSHFHGLYHTIRTILKHRRIAPRMLFYSSFWGAHD